MCIKHKPLQEQFVISITWGDFDFNELIKIFKFIFFKWKTFVLSVTQVAAASEMQLNEDNAVKTEIA